MELLVDIIIVIVVILGILGIIGLMGVFTRDDDYQDPTEF